jgi:hypothetical protein
MRRSSATRPVTAEVGSAPELGVFTPSGLDALPPVEMARKAEQVGVIKVGMSTANTFALSVLAGAFIALGAIFATTVTAGGADVPFGIVRLLGGIAFSLGLILVIVAGAELFTGNNLMVMAVASRQVTAARLLRTWVIVYVGDFVGALSIVAMVALAGWWTLDDRAVGSSALPSLRRRPPCRSGRPSSEPSSRTRWSASRCGSRPADGR